MCCLHVLSDAWSSTGAGEPARSWKLRETDAVPAATVVNDFLARAGLHAALLLACAGTISD